MLLTCEGIAKPYEIERLARMLFTPEDEETVLCRIEPDGDGFGLTARVTLGDCSAERTGRVPSALPERERVLALALLLHEASAELTGRSLRWGVLTGIRPIKLYHQALDEGLSDEQTIRRMAEGYAVSPAMSALALTIARSERTVHQRCRPDGIGLYLSIPFCPSRCSYCSFVSQTVERERALIAPYVERLCAEIAELGRVADRLGRVVQSVYVGGGTPTVLTPQQLEAVLDAVRRSFDLSALLEYTVEAGRPDTIDRPRLDVIKAAGVDRLSVNPQSMDDAVLAAVGRRHTAADVEKAMALAREYGFFSLNMDVIAGLPGDDTAGFARSVERVLGLAPDNLTVHTLTLKRTSFLALGDEAGALRRRTDEVAEMVDTARAQALKAGYAPYYLYRQKNAVGNLDNTGYALPGKEGLYNVVIMDETQTILAAGAGGVTKLCDADGRIERIFNRRLPYEYIRQPDYAKIQQERMWRFFEGHQ